MLTASLEVKIDGRCGSYWPYRNQPGDPAENERYPAVDLREESERQKVWDFPEVKAYSFLGEVILDLNDQVAGLFTFGCHKYKCNNQKCLRDHINVCVSSIHPEIASSWDSTLQRLGVPLTKHMASMPGENKGKFIRTRVVPYIIEVEGSDSRWMLVIETFCDAPEILHRAVKFLKEVGTTKTERVIRASAADTEGRP